MNEDLLKSAWHNMPAGKSNLLVKQMLKERSHPSLKRMRRQMLIEIVAYLFFLLVYVDFFDGHQKPVYANMLLVAAFAFSIVHNIAGYRLANARITGNNVRQLLIARLAGMKRFARVSIGSRVLLGVCFLLFFSSVISFTPVKAGIVLGIVCFFLVQLILLWKTWFARISHLEQTLNYFTGDQPSP